jgi:hypothetical protein
METEMNVGIDKPANNLIYGASIFSILLSLTLLFRKNPMLAVFVGLWPPTIMSLASFFKENRILDLEKRHAT